MSAAVDAFTPPHSDEAEQGVLGALLVDPQALDAVGDLVSAGDFYRPDHQAIWSTLQQLIGAGKLADVVATYEHGGHELTYLHQLAQSVISIRPARGWAEIVRARALERAMLRAGGEIMDLAVQAGHDVVAKIDRAQSMLATLADVRQAREPVGLSAALLAYLDHINAEAEGRTTVMSTGLRALDRQLNGGLRAGELMVIGARPKMGKTALTLHLQRAFAGHQHRTLMCSQEMPVNQLVARHTAAIGGINLAELRAPSQDDATGMWEKLAEATDVLSGYGDTMVFDDQRGLTLHDVRRKVVQTKRRGALSVVVVDFLQLMTGEGENRNTQLDTIANGLKAMAGEFEVGVVLLSQLSREADKRTGPPVMTDLRDCGAIEAAADIIALLYREYAHPLGNKGEEFKHHAQLEVVQRNGAPGTVNLSFVGETQRFGDWEGPAPFKAVKRSYASGAKGGMD